MKLYQLNEAIDRFEFEIDEDGVISNADELDSLQMARDEKIENCLLYVKNLKAEAVALKAEKESLEKRQKAAESKAKSLAEYVQRMLAGEKFKSTRASVSYKKSESVYIDEFAKVPEEYMVASKPRVDKVELKKALKEGKKFTGIKLQENQSMIIK